MKLYYSPGACSLAPHIVASELGIDLELDRVDLKTKKTASGEDFAAINPKGYVPALRMDDGAILTEGQVISQFLADLEPDAALVPPNNTLPRYRIQETLGYINSELHKSFSPLFNPATSAEVRAERETYLRKRFTLIEARLAEHEFLMGDEFSIADAYLYTVTNWSNFVKMDLAEFPHLMAFQERVGARPAVQAALRAEGLLE